MEAGADNMKIQLSIPIGINALYKQGRTHWYKDAKAVAWQNGAIYLIRAQMKKEKWVTMKGSTSVEIEWWRKDKRRFDIDGPIKLCLDTLVKAEVIKDDSLIDTLYVQKFHTNKKDNFCIVDIY